MSVSLSFLAARCPPSVAARSLPGVVSLLLACVVCLSAVQEVPDAQGDTADQEYRYEDY